MRRKLILICAVLAAAVLYVGLHSVRMDSTHLRGVQTSPSRPQPSLGDNVRRESEPHPSETQEVSGPRSKASSGTADTFEWGAALNSASEDGEHFFDARR